jgi:hypothetical protein
MTGAATTGTEIHYFTAAELMIRGVDSGQDQLVDFQKGIIYHIDNKKKVISKLAFTDAMTAMASVNQPSNEAAMKTMATMFGDPNACSVVKTGNEQIAGRNCQSWHITVGKLVMDLSADPTLKAPMADSSYAEMMKTQAAQFAQVGPMGAIFKRLYEEMAKIKGIQLKTHMTGMMGMDVATLATKVETGSIPPSTFALPAGYPVEDLGPKLKARMGKSN